MTYSTDRTQSAMRRMSASVTALRSARAEGVDMMVARAAAEYSEDARVAAASPSDPVPSRRKVGDPAQAQPFTARRPPSRKALRPE
jgi:hypothetical protein